MQTPLISIVFFIIASFLGALGQWLYKSGADAAGNTLASEAVIESMVAAFEDADGQSLALRLLLALEAGEAAGGDRRDTVLRETGLTLGFIRDTLGVEGQIDVKLSCDDPVVDAALREWLAAQDHLAPAPDGGAPPCGPTTVVSRIGAARIAPAVAVVTGELR